MTKRAYELAKIMPEAIVAAVFLASNQAGKGPSTTLGKTTKGISNSKKGWEVSQSLW